MEQGTLGVPSSDVEVDTPNKDRWAQALVKNVAAVTVAFRGAGDQRHAARRTYLQLAPEARTESYLEVIDEVLYQSTALARLTRNARMAVARRAHVVEFQPGEALCVRGAQQDALLVVMSGEVAIVDGHWDGSVPPPPDQPSRVRGQGQPSSLTALQPPTPQQQQLSSHHHSRRHLTEQLSMASSIGTSSTAAAAGPGSPAPHPAPHPAAGLHSLQLDSRHTIHPALQSHPSARRHAHHSHVGHRPNSRASIRGGGARGSGGGGGAVAADGGGAVAAAGSGPVLLGRGDSLGAVDMGWLSRLPPSVAAAALDEIAATPAITSRALLATRAEMASGGSFSGQAPGHGGSSGAAPEAFALSSGTGGGGGGGPRSSSSSGAPAGQEGGGGVSAAEGGGERGGGGRGSVDGGWEGGGGGGPSGGNGSDALQRLRWPCTAMAVGGRVECAAIGLQQLVAVLATEIHWDVEAMVESLEELPVFAALSGTELRQLVRVLRLNTFSGGTVVYKQGSVGNDLFIIRSGCVRLLKQVALDDGARNRLNRISAELAAVRDQTAAAAALLHGQYGMSVAPFGSSAGFAPLSGPSSGLSAGRASTPASLSGSTSTPPSPARARRLSQCQGWPPGGVGGGGGGGGVGASQSGGWSSSGRCGGTPGSPREELHSSHSAAAAVSSTMGRGLTSGPASAPVHCLRDRTPPPRLPAAGNPLGGSSPQQPSPAGSRPDSGSGPVGPGLGQLPLRRLPECGPRAHSSGSAGCCFKEVFGGAAAASADGLVRRHSATAPVVPGSPGGASSSHPHRHHHHHQHHQHHHHQHSYPYSYSYSTPQTPALVPPQAQRPGSQKGQGGGGGGWRQNRLRRRGSHVTADELLGRLGGAQRGPGEKPEAMCEDEVMAGTTTPGTPSAAGVTPNSGEMVYGSSDSEGADGPGSPVALPPVNGPRPPSTSQLQAGWAAAAAAAVGSSGAVPVWQARAPRQLGSAQELVFVEMGVLTAGQCFGEVRYDGVALRSCTAVCDTRTEVLAISRNELHQRMGGRVFEYLWNQRPQLPHDGPQSPLDPSAEAGQCAQQLERTMQWALFKQKLVAEVLTQKEQRKRTALKCR